MSNNLELQINQELLDAVEAEFPIDRPADKCSYPGCLAQHRASRSDVVFARALQAAMPEGEKISSNWRDDGWHYFLNWPTLDDGFYCPVHAKALESMENTPRAGFTMTAFNQDAATIYGRTIH